MMKRLGKILVIFLLISVIAAGFFIAGMIFQAQFYGPTLASSSETALPFPAVMGGSGQSEMTAEDVPPEFATFWEAWSFLNDQFYGERRTGAYLRSHGRGAGLPAQFPPDGC